MTEVRTTPVPAGTKVKTKTRPLLRGTVTDGGTVEIRGFASNAQGPVKHLVIPAEIDGVPVRSIADSAFVERPIERLSFADGAELDVIGDKAFSGCGLKAIDSLPAEKLGALAFAYNDIEEISSWDSVVYIGRECFRANGLREIPRDWGSVFSLGKKAFKDNRITELPQSWAGIGSIASACFASNNIESLPRDWGVIGAIGPGVFTGNRIEALPGTSAASRSSAGSRSAETASPCPRQGSPRL